MTTVARLNHWESPVMSDINDRAVEFFKSILSSGNYDSYLENKVAKDFICDLMKKFQQLEAENAELKRKYVQLQQSKLNSLGKEDREVIRDSQINDKSVCLSNSSENDKQWKGSRMDLKDIKLMLDNRIEGCTEQLDNYAEKMLIQKGKWLAYKEFSNKIKCEIDKELSNDQT